MQFPTGALLLHAAYDEVNTLGPGPAAGLWTQGCGHNCPGCMSRETFALMGGRWAAVHVVADWIIGTGRRFVTISGGEPMEQSVALVALIDEIRARSDIVVTCYSGFYLAELLELGRPGVQELVDRLDILIDGRYVQELHAPLLWRGSTNQTIHDLSGRVSIPADSSRGIDIRFNHDGSFRFIGVPPAAGLTERFEEHAAADGIVAASPQSALPFHSIPFAHARRVTKCHPPEPALPIGHDSRTRSGDFSRNASQRASPVRKGV